MEEEQEKSKSHKESDEPKSPALNESEEMDQDEESELQANPEESMGDHSPAPSSVEPPSTQGDENETSYSEAQKRAEDTGTPLLDDVSYDNDEITQRNETPTSEDNEQNRSREENEKEKDDDNPEEKGRDNEESEKDKPQRRRRSSQFQEDADINEGDLSKFPDQIFANEKSSETETTRNLADLNDSENANPSNDNNENFEEIDVNASEKNKTSNIDEIDALGEDRTQVISESSQNDDGTKNKKKGIDNNSEMDVDQDQSNIEEGGGNLKDAETNETEEVEDGNDSSRKTKSLRSSRRRKSRKDTEDEVTIERENEDSEMSKDKDSESTLQSEEQMEEGQVIEAAPNESEDVCLLPDEEKELTGAEKERALQARKEAEKEATEAEAASIENDLERNDTRVSTPTDEVNEQEQNEIDASVQEGDAAADTSVLELKEFEIQELSANISEYKCYQCGETKFGKYKLLENGEFRYLCDIDCVNEFRTIRENEQYKLICRRTIITSIFEIMQKCEKCKIEQNCHYRYKDAETEKFLYICEGKCLTDFIGKNTEKYLVRRKKYTVEELLKDVENVCVYCKEKKSCKFSFKQDDDTLYVCEEACYYLLSKEEPDRFRIFRRSVRVRDLGSTLLTNQTDNEPKIVARTEAEALAAKLDRTASFIRRCAHCLTEINENSDKLLLWETQDFCNEICLGKYQNTFGARCQCCNESVSLPSLGKYCVRFGFEVRQFCSSSCLDRFKKGVKVCSLCQKDISKNKEGFLAPVGDKGQFKDFCSQNCLKRYEELHNPRKKSIVAQCSVCNNEKTVRVDIILDARLHHFCSNPCFSAFKFVNNIVPDQCTLCTKFFERKSTDSFTIYNDKPTKVFCSKICMNLYITMTRKIVPCQWCKVKKYNFDMIQKQCGPQILMLCSLNCLTLYGVSLNAISMRQQKCDQCGRQATPQYHLTMSDTTIRNFCTYQCVMSFQSQFGRTPLTLEGVAEKEADGGSPFPTSLPKRIKQNVTAGTVQIPTVNKGNVESPYVPIIANVESLASHQLMTSEPGVIAKRTYRKSRARASKTDIPAPPAQVDSYNFDRMPRKLVNTQTQTKPPARRTVGTVTLERDEVKTKVVTIPPLPPPTDNKMTMCRPNTSSKAVSCRPNSINVECQTGKDLYQKIPIPVPVPIYVPEPMYMYSLPCPIPVPIPLPIPVPIFIPTTRNSAAGILKEIKKIQDKMPSNPYEADLLMMAELVAGEKKKEESDSEDDTGINNDDDFVTESVEPSNSFGEDMLQMALKMATEYEEPAVDLESAMATNTITPQVHPHHHIQDDDIHSHQMIMIDGQRQVVRGRKRVLPMDGSIQATSPRNNRLQTTPPQKRQRRSELQQQQQQPQIIQPVEPIKQEPTEKPDANMCLKYTFGVNAWKQWVTTKNADLEKSTLKRRPFKSELLQMTADELNYSLCLFVKEVRKPNGSEYAPDTIYYLVLGIQQYLYENGRIDNIFTDPYYERFTDCLDEVARKFSILYNDSQYIVTRVEEEHLWECKQLGAHSPHVLLSTLMFFNTKHFNLTSVDEHMQLSFSHIMKHWKRSTPGSKAPGSRNVLLRFYPPQTGPEANPRKKKVYEQQENETNPLRCPVKLYEFYLSKCPESVKTRNDVFYLQPERSCVPDSPVWYSTQPLSREALSKMLHRVKMVKEINIALLTS